MIRLLQLVLAAVVGYVGLHHFARTQFAEVSATLEQSMREGDERLTRMREEAEARTREMRRKIEAELTRPRDITVRLPQRSYSGR